MDADIAIVGGGPVGLAVALYAVRAGLVPLLLEPRPVPVDKACGEGLMPGAVVALGELGVRLTGRPFTGIRYVDNDRSVDARFGRLPGLGVRRTVLHRGLADAAQDAGVEVRAAAMSGIDQHDHGVRVRVGSDATAVTGRYLVAADGLHSPTRRLLGLDGPASGTRRFGLRRHFAVSPWTDRVEVHWSPVSEAYVTPVAEDLVGVAVLGRGRGSWPQRLADFPALLTRLGDAEPVTAVRGAGPLRTGARSRRCGRVLLAGDAGGYVDAVTGEGIAVGLAQAQAAVTAIAADQPQSYPRQAARVSRRSSLLTAGLVSATATAVGRRAVLGTARAAPWLFTGVVRLAAAPVSRPGPVSSGATARPGPTTDRPLEVAPGRPPAHLQRRRSRPIA